MHYKGSTQLGYGARFLQKLPWWTIKPTPNRISYHAEIDNYYDPYAAEIENGLLIYFRRLFETNEFKALGLIPNKVYEYIFFDPITGKEYPFETFKPDEKGEWEIAHTPIMQDWVLWIRGVD